MLDNDEATLCEQSGLLPGFVGLHMSHTTCKTSQRLGASRKKLEHIILHFSSSLIGSWACLCCRVVDGTRLAYEAKPELTRH